MTTKVKIQLTQKGFEDRNIAFSTNHPIRIVEMWMKTKDWRDEQIQGDWAIAKVSFSAADYTENCIWDGIINKWMLERNT